MPLPQPAVPLSDVCSVIHNNTLYTYSASAFQSLALDEGAEWVELPAGQSVTGGVCVGSTPQDPSQAGLYVVGGKGSDPTYSGLQKFTYSTGTWQTLTPSAVVTQDRLWHGAVYINSTDSILMYAGSQDGSQNPSSQTFTIGASAPYTVLSYQSVAPPTINPILLPWSETQAALLGGCDTNTKVMLFSPATAWVDSGASLAEPIQKNTTAVQAVIVTGDDGCKNLYTFDMTISPNEVNRTVLLNGQGAPVQDSVAIVSRSLDTPGWRPLGERQPESLTLDDWPQYNSTLAPTTTRSSYSVAEDPNGIVVFTGGNQEDVLCMFDGRTNGWENATARLEQKPLASSSTTSSASATASTSLALAASSTTTPTSSPSATATSDSSGIPTNTVLGITLGSIFGFAIILVLLYLLIRRHERRQAHMEAGHARRASGASSTEKDGVGFVSDSLPQIPKGIGVFRGHHPQDSQSSFSSMAILMGKVSHQKNPSLQQQPQQPPTSPRLGQQAAAKRTPTPEKRRLSADSEFSKQFKSTISKPILQNATTQAQPGAPPVREEKGVSFAAGTAAQSRARGPGGPPTDRQGSTRRSSGWNRYWSGGSTLNILGYGNNAASKRTTVDSDQSSRYSDQQHRMTQDSATVPPLHVDGRASFHRVNSGSPTVSQYSKHLKEAAAAQIERPPSRASSGYSSGIPASVHDTWDPTAVNKPWGADRAPSSAYSSFVAPPAAASSTEEPVPKIPTGVSRQPQLAMAATSSDMSWLNLGDFARLKKTEP